MYAHTRVRDSSEKPATGVACEVQRGMPRLYQRIARPERSEGHAFIYSSFCVKFIKKLNEE